MASPFAKYQSEQVQQIAPGFVEAYGRAGASIGQGIAAVGAGVGQYIEKTEQKKKEEIATKAALAPYIKNDQRVQVVEGLFKAGILTKATDGTAVVAADYAGKVDMAALEKNLSFYNTTGGDGSKLSGNALIEFTARFQSEQKYVSDQAGRAKAKLDLDLQQAQIDDLKSKAAERVQNAGMYEAANNLLLGGTPSVSSTLPSVTLPDTSTPGFQSLVGAPVSKADTTVTGVAATTVPKVYYNADTAAAKEDIPGAPPSASPTQQAILDRFNESKKTVPAAPAAQAPAQATATPATTAQKPVAASDSAAAPAPAAPAPAPAPAAAAPAAPVTYDVPAKAAEVAEKMKAVGSKRTAVRAKFANIRTATEGELAISNANARAKIRPNAVGNKLAEATRSYNDYKLKAIADAEDRETKAVDAEAEAIKFEFTNYQAAATAAREGRREIREIKKQEADLTAAEEELVSKLVKGYPMIGVYTYRGYNLKDPKTGKRVNPAIAANIPAMPTEQYTEASEQNKGYGAAKNFLLNMSDVLRDRENGGDEYAYLERFRLTAKNMENYFKAEQASVFGVATFRKAIVSGGNFSDADREFVKQAITYLNSGAVDMTNKDLRSSLNALTFMIDGMYRVNLEELGMAYNKEAALEKISALRAGGDEAGAAGVEKQIKTTERFNNTFKLQQDKASSISKETIAKARAEMQKGFKGFKFDPKASESK